MFDSSSSSFLFLHSSHSPQSHSSLSSSFLFSDFLADLSSDFFPDLAADFFADSLFKDFFDFLSSSSSSSSSSDSLSLSSVFFFLDLLLLFPVDFFFLLSPFLFRFWGNRFLSLLYPYYVLIIPYFCPVPNFSLFLFSTLPRS